MGYKFLIFGYLTPDGVASMPNPSDYEKFPIRLNLYGYLLINLLILHCKRIEFRHFHTLTLCSVRKKTNGIRKTKY